MGLTQATSKNVTRGLSGNVPENVQRRHLRSHIECLSGCLKAARESRFLTIPKEKTVQHTRGKNVYSSQALISS